VYPGHAHHRPAEVHQAACGRHPVEAVEAVVVRHQKAVPDPQAVQAEAVVVQKEGSIFGRKRLCEY
jgi:hypothetical protein